MAATVRRELNRLVSAPARGRDTSEPAAMASYTSARAAGLRCSVSRTWGIRDAQLAKANPEAVNAT